MARLYADENCPLLVVQDWNSRARALCRGGVFMALEGGTGKALEARVRVLPDEAKGEIPKSCVVLKPGATVTASQLEIHCRQNLAAYKIPRVIEFLDKVPKTASGTTRRFLLRQYLGK